MTEIATYQPQGVALLDPTGGRLVAWAEAAVAANQLAKSLCTTAFVPRVKVGGQMVPMSPGDATAAILMGDELGLSPIASLRSIYVVHGTPAMYTRTMVALTQGHGHEVWTEETSPGKVTVCAKRRGGEHVERATWTIARAQKAGYTSNSKYQSNPEEMLYAKAAAEVCRKVAADVMAGVPYSVEDLELEQPQPTSTVTRGASPKTSVQRAKAPEPAEPAFEEPAPPTEEPKPASRDQVVKLNIQIQELGITGREEKLDYISTVTNRPIKSSNDLTMAEASKLIDDLEHPEAAAQYVPDADAEPPLDDPTSEPGWGGGNG
ncbi:MAG TPA: hypothetical protein VIL68_02530 [Propionibacteriaceae bacterium]